MYYDDQGDYTQEQFDKIYDKIYEELTSGYYKQEHRVAYLLGGQPGSGKSTFYTDNNELMGYVVVDGDKFRKYHPNINDIIRNILNIQKWNLNFQQHQNEYYALKMGLLKEAMNHNHAE